MLHAHLLVVGLLVRKTFVKNRNQNLILGSPRNFDKKKLFTCDLWHSP